MKHSPTRLAVALRAIALGGMAAVAAGLLTGCASTHNGVTAPTPSGETDSAVMPVRALMADENVIVVNCLSKELARPTSFVLTCADYFDYLTGLHWVNWRSEAFATGTEVANTCTPSCAKGKFISYPALVALWRPEPLPGHPGVLYFTRITRIYMGKRPPFYNCHGVGTPPCYPVTSTLDLWSQMGG